MRFGLSHARKHAKQDGGGSKEHTKRGLTHSRNAGDQGADCKHNKQICGVLHTFLVGLFDPCRMAGVQHG
jgi:hypothetical protein